VNEISNNHNPITRLNTNFEIQNKRVSNAIHLEEEDRRKSCSRNRSLQVFSGSRAVVGIGVFRSSWVVPGHQ
jgi:hypothetical protein